MFLKRYSVVNLSSYFFSRNKFNRANTANNSDGVNGAIATPFGFVSDCCWAKFSKATKWSQIN